VKAARIANLPTAPDELNPEEEQIMRRTIEQYLAILHDDVSEQQNQTSKPSTLAQKRHQFLLMGG
jgi:hypothetical protein